MTHSSGPEDQHPRSAHRVDDVHASRGPEHSPGAAELTDPLRHPGAAGSVTRTKRAWLLLALTTFVPGSAQMLAGHRGLGKKALTVTVGVWCLILLGVLIALIHRAWLFDLVTNNFLSLVLIVVLVLLAIGWALLFLDTLRIIRPTLLARGMRPVVAIGCAALMLVTAGTLGYSAYLVGVGRGALGNVFAQGEKFKPIDGRYNFLLMGGDAGADRVGRRPDSMTVFSVDAKTGQAVTISLPRNMQNAPFAKDSPLWQIYPDGYNCGDECILNALYTDVTSDHQDLYPNASDPGAEAMKDAAEGITGLPIQAYVLVDMDGFANLIDAMGGIELNVGGRVPIGGGHDMITGAPNPIDGYIEPGRQRLDGFHALWYARSREGASDFEREARQRCVQSAMLAQMDPANVLTKFQSITDAGQKIIETDIPEAQLSSFVDVGLKAKNHELIQFGAGPPYFDAMFPTYPDYDEFRASVSTVIQDSKDGKTPTPAPSDGQATAASARGGSSDVLGLVGPTALFQTIAMTQGKSGASLGANGPSALAVENTADDAGSNGSCSVP